MCQHPFLTFERLRWRTFRKTFLRISLRHDLSQKLSRELTTWILEFIGVVLVDLNNTQTTPEGRKSIRKRLPNYKFEPNP